MPPAVGTPKIETVANAGSYQSSSWLTFVLPIGSGRGAQVDVRTAVPQIQVPLPLRTYPTPPALVAQSGIAHTPGATAIADARRWDYRFDYASAKAAQDTEHVLVTFDHSGNRSLPGFFSVAAYSG